jgi:uncharacterized RDD family membrane protein YckC
MVGSTLERSAMETSRTYELADVGERFIALIVDSLIVSFIGGLLGSNSGWWLGGTVGFLIGVGYQWYFLTRYEGQTLGKMMMSIRVIKVDGTPISDTDAVLRYIGYLINSPIFMLGWIWALFDSNHQGWHDKIAKTYVVKAGGDKSKRKNEDTVKL